MRYRQESNVPANRGREIYAEAKARKNGLQAAMLTLATFTGTSLFRQATGVPADSAVVKMFQDIVFIHGGSMAKEAFGGAGSVFNQEKQKQNYGYK